MLANSLHRPPRRGPGWLPSLALVFYFVLAAAPATAEDPGFAVDHPKERQPAPNFSLPDAAGKRHAPADYRGQVVLINFWATWCAPCRDEMPALEQLWRRYRERGLMILGIAADRGDRQAVMAYAERIGIDFPILYDSDGSARKRYEVVGLPMSYLLGRDGKFSGRVIGLRDWTSDGARAFIEDLLDE